MRLPLSWLRDFCDCSLPPEDLARRLALSGLEIEAIDRIGVWSNDVILARIDSVARHPESTKLHVVELDLGNGTRATAMSGAPNIGPPAVGRFVAAARIGARLIRGDSERFELFEVVARPMLGVDSNAVLCSPRELGLTSDHTGVLFIDSPNPKAGDLVREQVAVPEDALADVVLDVAILPNYGRCTSIVGLAREIAALTRTSFRLELDATYLPIQANAFDIEIDDPDLCPRYTCHVLEGVRAARSPDWLERRLVLAGQKPINLLVDVTNYVMLELGQPMHAFDLDRLPARAIRVRRARAGETMHTLDQKPPEGATDRTLPAPRKLDPSLLLITSGTDPSKSQPIAIAGVIGGFDSQIHDDTRTILLESANFDAVAVRKATQALKLNTDSSYRFSREIDPNLTAVAIGRAVWILTKTLGIPASGAICDRYPGRREPREIDVRLGEIERLLGMELSADEVTSALERLGFGVETAEAPDVLRVGIPGFRTDVSIAADVAEEVIRVIGFERLEGRHLAEPLPRQRRHRPWELRREIRSYLAGAGLQEILSYSLIDASIEARLDLASSGFEATGPYLSVLHPATEERVSLRRSLTTGLLEAVARNHRVRDRIALFETGLVWHTESGDGTLPAELLRLGIVVSGPIDAASWQDIEPRAYDYFDLKGILEGLAERLRLPPIDFERNDEAPYHPGVSARMVLGGRTVGTLGRLHPRVARSFDLDDRNVFVAAVDLEAWIHAARPSHPYLPYSRFPVLRQDLNLVVAEEIAADVVERAIVAAAGPLLTAVRLLNVYRGPQIGEGRKSLSFRMEFVAEGRSLEESEVNTLREAMLPRLRSAIGAEIR
jgi:phenylalanyl-tRNA synthetase beta chain